MPEQNPTCQQNLITLLLQCLFEDHRVGILGVQAETKETNMQKS